MWAFARGAWRGTAHLLQQQQRLQPLSGRRMPRKVADRQRNREEAELHDGVGDGTGNASIFH